MSTTLFRPREAVPPKPSPATIPIPPPIKREEKGKVSAGKIILGVSMAVLMVFFMIMMFTVMGRQPNPMMMMGMMTMMVGMLAGAGSIFVGGVGGGDVSDLDRKRQSVDIQIEDSTEEIRDVADMQQQSALFHHPNPLNIRRMVEARHITYWSGDVTESVEPNAFRIGVGSVGLVAELKVNGGEDESLEHLHETYSSVAVTRLQNMLSVVPEVPITRAFDAPAYGFRGPDQGKINGFIRSFLLSAMYKYSPKKVMVGVVAPTSNEWGWLKWAPHSKNRMQAPGQGGYTQLAWRSMEEFYEKFLPLIPTLEQTRTRLYVVVDDPNLSMKFPEQYPDGIPNVTFIAADVYDDDAVMGRKHRFKVDGDRVTMLRAKRAVRADFTNRFDAELTTRAMAADRPDGFEFVSTVDRIDEQEEDDVTVDVESLPTILEYLNIPNLDDFDLKREVWDKNEYTETLKSMFGYDLNQANKPTGRIATLDIFEVANGGTGPHGMMSGGTGTGKSFMMTAIVLGLILSYSPSKLNFIFMDFKGGPTWKPFIGIKHELATITNLAKAVEMLDRAQAAIEGELQRRQEIIAEHPDVENIIYYRRKQKVTPGMDPLPFLFIIADETHEFLLKHREYVKIFERIGAIGRALGVHLLLGSQYLSESVVGDFINHSTFGISLRVKKENESGTVLHGERSATRLPPSKVALYWRTELQDDIITRVMAYDWTKPYRRAIRSAERPAVEQAPIARPVEVHEEDVVPFDMYHAPERPVAEDGTPAPVVRPRRVEGTEDTGMTLLTASVELVKRAGANYHPHQPWKEPLSYPLTFWHLQDGFTAPDGVLQLRIGDVDVPFEHTRIPMTVEFSGSQSACAIVGSSKTGTTNTVRAMIAASATQYPADYISWCLYDYKSTDLHCMTNWPNVSAYATRSDEDTFLRMRGELNRIIERRETVMDDNRLRTVDEYLQRRGELGVTDDPYGHIFLVIDGFDKFFDDFGQDFMLDRDRWMSFLTRGPRVGVRLVYTTTTMAGRMPKFLESTGVKVFHSVQDPTGVSAEVREGIRSLPVTVPGTSVNTDRVDMNNTVEVLRSRVFVPIEERILPDREYMGAPVFNVKDYSDKVGEYGSRLTAMSNPDGTPRVLAPRITEVPPTVPFSTLSHIYRNFDWRQYPRGQRVLPMGLDRATYTPLALDLMETPHMFVAGTGHAGVSSTLRTAINSITTVYGPDEAAIMIIDGRMGLLDMVDSLVERGYMKRDNYAVTTEQASPIIMRTAAMLEDRKPKGDLTPAQMRGRDYVTGKEVFFIVDGFDAMRVRVPGLLEPGTLEWLGNRLPKMNVGVHFFVGTDAAGMVQWVGSNKFTGQLTTAVPTRNIMLNGNAEEGRIFNGVPMKFRKFPKGRALWHKMGGEVDQVVQIAHSEPLS